MLGGYIDKYLAMIVMAFNGTDKVAFISMGIKTLSNYLGYKGEKSIYGFISKLEELGLLKINKNKGLTMFFKSNKIINLKEKKEEKLFIKETENKEYEAKKVVNGIQYGFKLDNSNITSEYYECVNTIKIEGRKTLRGSPPNG